jgi:hypothetical protein
MDAEIKREFERINQKLTALLTKEKKETWVKSTEIIKLTGWDKERMRQARENGYVKVKRDKKGIFYSLESLPEIFIKNA